MRAPFYYNEEEIKSLNDIMLKYEYGYIAFSEMISKLSELDGKVISRRQNEIIIKNQKKLEEREMQNNMNEFMRDGNIVRSKSNHFIELIQYGRYAVLMRFKQDDKSDHKRLNFMPYVVACGYDEKTGTWESGEYFADLFDAVDYAKSRAYETHISYDRMSEIATMAIDEIFRLDESEALIYFEDEIEMEDSEMEYFQINEKGE